MEQRHQQYDRLPEPKMLHIFSHANSEVFTTFAVKSVEIRHANL